MIYRREKRGSRFPHIVPAPSEVYLKEIREYRAGAKTLRERGETAEAKLCGRRVRQLKKQNRSVAGTKVMMAPATADVYPQTPRQERRGNEL